MMRLLTYLLACMLITTSTNILSSSSNRFLVAASSRMCMTRVFACAKNGKTPTYMASVYGHIEELRLLIENGADVNTPDKVSE